MARTDAAPLITLADKITHEGSCAQARDIRRLGALRIRLIQAHKIPPALQEPLSSGVNALVAQTPVCLPPVAAATVAPPVVTIVPEQGKTHERGHHGQGEGKGKGKGKD
jgi:hypothetical protein